MFCVASLEEAKQIGDWYKEARVILKKEGTDPKPIDGESKGGAPLFGCLAQGTACRKARAALEKLLQPEVQEDETPFLEFTCESQLSIEEIRSKILENDRSSERYGLSTK